MENTSDFLNYEHVAVRKDAIYNTEHVIVWKNDKIIRKFDANFGYVDAVNDLKSFLKEFQNT